MNTYIAAYAIRIRPKIILTFIDNRPEFYELSSYIPDVYTILIQNGLRDNFFDLDYLNDAGKVRKVDFMLMFNARIADYYANSISGKSVVVGSIRNNSVKKTLMKSRNTVVYISIGIESRPKSNNYIETNCGEKVLYDDLIRSDEVLFKYALSWCAQHKYQLIVCGKNQEPSGEFDFFRRLCEPGLEFEFVPWSSALGSYELVDHAFMAIGTDSTLCYESLARGNRTVFFHCRSEKFKVQQPFGWPGVLPESGPFWTNSRSEAEFDRVMNSVASATDEEFAKMREPYIDDLMVWDPDNRKAKALINSILDTNRLAI